MRILITGADGFIAKNLRVILQLNKENKIYTFSKDDSINILEAYLQEVDFIYHLAGVNRPKNIQEFYDGNVGLTKTIISILEKYNKKTPIVFSSSIQAELDNDYGISKKEAEKIIESYAKKHNINYFIFRLPNVFGKWSKPNYNSVISTWCYNISHNKKIKVDDENKVLQLVYVDDIVNAFVKCLNDNEIGHKSVKPIYKKTLKEIKNLLYEFKNNRKTLIIPNVANGFERALYATYLSYLDKNDFSYKLNGNKDDRGIFYEILKTKESGQFSLSTTKPGITRGNHYHHTKNEKFLVVKGEALIEFRHIITNEKVEYKVSGEQLEIVEMIPGYTHNITNIGDEELLLFLWANEQFDLSNPDTYFLKV